MSRRRKFNIFVYIACFYKNKENQKKNNNQVMLMPNKSWLVKSVLVLVKCKINNVIWNSCKLVLKQIDD